MAESSGRCGCWYSAEDGLPCPHDPHVKASEPEAQPMSEERLTRQKYLDFSDAADVLLSRLQKRPPGVKDSPMAWMQLEAENKKLIVDAFEAVTSRLRAEVERLRALVGVDRG